MSNEIRLLYFASLAEQLDCNEESLPYPQKKIKVLDLKSTLAERGGRWLEAMSAETTKCAVNQSLANDSTLINPNDEVAFFPPVTGG